MQWQTASTDEASRPRQPDLQRRADGVVIGWSHRLPSNASVLVPHCSWRTVLAPRCRHCCVLRLRYPLPPLLCNAVVVDDASSAIVLAAHSVTLTAVSGPPHWSAQTHKVTAESVLTF